MAVPLPAGGLLLPDTPTFYKESKVYPLCHIAGKFICFQRFRGWPKVAISRGFYLLVDGHPQLNSFFGGNGCCISEGKLTYPFSYFRWVRDNRVITEIPRLALPVNPSALLADADFVSVTVL